VSINIGICVGSVNRHRGRPVPNVACFRHLKVTVLFGLDSGYILLRYIILSWFFKKCDVGIWTGLSWLKIETGG
jgi:hypothetical protein